MLWSFSSSRGISRSSKINQNGTLHTGRWCCAGAAFSSTWLACEMLLLTMVFLLKISSLWLRSYRQVQLAFSPFNAGFHPTGCSGGKSYGHHYHEKLGKVYFVGLEFMVVILLWKGINQPLIVNRLTLYSNSLNTFWSFLRLIGHLSNPPRRKVKSEICIWGNKYEFIDSCICSSSYVRRSC